MTFQLSIDCFCNIWLHPPSHSLPVQELQDLPELRSNRLSIYVCTNLLRVFILLPHCRASKFKLGCIQTHRNPERDPVIH